MQQHLGICPQLNERFFYFRIRIHLVSGSDPDPGKIMIHKNARGYSRYYIVERRQRKMTTSKKIDL